MDENITNLILYHCTIYIEQVHRSKTFDHPTINAMNKGL